jgi:galactokinase/mevalonate kinase-like predicted kinase
VDQTIPAGGSITLTTTPEANMPYDQNYSRNWGGAFLNGTTNLYAYVDVWSDEQYSYGAVEEINESNNLASQQITVTATTATTMLQANGTENSSTIPIPPRVFPIK